MLDTESICFDDGFHLISFLIYYLLFCARVIGNLWSNCLEVDILRREVSETLAMRAKSQGRKRSETIAKQDNILGHCPPCVCFTIVSILFSKPLRAFFSFLKRSNCIFKSRFFSFFFCLSLNLPISLFKFIVLEMDHLVYEYQYKFLFQKILLF